MGEIDKFGSNRPTELKFRIMAGVGWGGMLRCRGRQPEKGIMYTFKEYRKGIEKYLLI